MSAAICLSSGTLDIVVRTLYKTLVITGVDATNEVTEFKDLLHKRGLQEQIPIPVASKQRLVFKGTVLTSGSLQDAGLRSGDHVVLLLHRPHASTSARPMDTTPVPNAATIRNAIIAEARRRGIENTIMEDPSRGFRHYGGVPMDVDNQLLQLIQALRGRPSPMEAHAGQLRQAAGAGGGGPAAAGQQQSAEGGSRVARRAGQAPMLNPGMAAPGMMLFGMPAPAPAAVPSLSPPAIPEPDAQAATQLGEMGFGEAVVRKALLLHRNDMETALNWLLQHGEDPAAAEPLTDEQLRQIYGRGPRGPPSELELVEQLVAMGFDRNQSAAALHRFRNMDMALAYLLRAAEEEDPAAAQQLQQQQQPGGGTVTAEGLAGAAVAAATGQQRASAQPVQAAAAAPGVAGTAAVAAGSGDGGGEETVQARSGHAGGHARHPDDGDSMIDLPELISINDAYVDTDMRAGFAGGRHGAEPGRAQRAADEGADGGLAGGARQPGAGSQAQRMAVDGSDDERPDGADDGDEMDEDDAHEEDDEEEEDDDDDFTGDDGMPTMIEQLAMGQGGGGGRGAVLHVPLGGGGGLGLATNGMPDDPMAAMGAFEAPFVLYGGASHSVAATAPAIAVTRGPDGNDLVLGSAGASMPPLMPARGMMLGGMGMGNVGVGGGMAQPVDLPGLLQGGGPGEDDLELPGMGLVQQLLNAVLRDAMGGGGGEGTGAAPGNRR